MLRAQFRMESRGWGNEVLLGQPSLRVTLSVVSPSVMVMLRLFMWLPLEPEGLAGLAVLLLPWLRP